MVSLIEQSDRRFRIKVYAELDGRVTSIVPAPYQPDRFEAECPPLDYSLAEFGGIPIREQFEATVVKGCAHDNTP